MNFKLGLKQQIAFKSQRNQSTKYSYSKFNVAILTISLFPLLSIGLFNLAIDPYGIIGSPTFPGINFLKPEQDKHNKLLKSIDIIRFKPTTILIGSSRTILGLDPNHPGLSDNKKAYNLGLPGIHMHGLRAYLQHALINQPKIKQIVIGLDFFMFNDLPQSQLDLDENLDRTKLPIQSLLKTIFSLEGFKSSQVTLVVNRHSRGFMPYYSNGMRNTNQKINSHLENVSSFSMKERFKIDIRNYLDNPSYYKNYHLSRQSLNDYKTIVDFCKRKNIDLRVFISPEPATQLEAIRVAGLWSVFEQWKREITEVAPLWDFADYNSITIEDISKDMNFFLDGTHYRKEVGDLILNRVLSYREKTVPDDFGTWLTPETSELHLSKIRANRDIWEKNNPDAVKLVETIKYRLEVERKNKLEK